MSKLTTVRDDLYKRWKDEQDQDGLTSLSFSDWIDMLVAQGSGLQVTTINQEGRFDGSKGLAGKRIEWRIRE
jgi:hypothetical protein